jgi:hypothetical protein
VTGIRRDDEKALPPGLPGALRRLDPAEWFNKDHPEPMLASYELGARHLTAFDAVPSGIPWSGRSSCGGLMVVGPGGGLVVAGSGLEAAVQDVDEAVAELS